MRYVFRHALVLSFLLLPMAAQGFDRRTPVVQAVEKAGPAVVNIRTEQIVQRRSSPFFGFADPFFEEFFGDFARPRVYKTQSLGSGVIIAPRGYVLTNAHVVAKASKIYVALPDRQKEVEAQLVGEDDALDLAVLQLRGEGPFPFIEPGRSDDLIVGETVIAIGNPLGLGHSVTTGVVSAPVRRLPLKEGVHGVFIQTDALINPGNSGGPLLNINGELIGINTAIASRAQGIGFAIPITTARRVLSDLEQHGRLRPSWLGVVPDEISEALTRSRGLGGVLVTAVEENSPAARADIRIADVILAVDGVPVESAGEFQARLRTYPPGEKLSLDLLRGTDEMTLAVTLAPLPAGYAGRYALRTFGFSVRETNGLLQIARVTNDSPAAAVGLRAGDVLTEIEGQKLKNLDDFERAIIERRNLLPVKFLFFRGSRGYYIELP